MLKQSTSRTNTRFFENFSENINGRTPFHVAQIRPNCSQELYYKLPRKLRVWTHDSVPRTHPVQHPRHQAWTEAQLDDNTEAITEQLQKQIAEIDQAAKDNLMQSYLKYKQYYDKKATATPLKVNDYCYVLIPKADNQSRKFAFKDCIWTGPYTVVKVLSNNNYVVRRTGTRYTQILQRIRLKLYAPNQRVPDVTVRRDDYLPDPEVKTTHNDW